MSEYCSLVDGEERTEIEWLPSHPHPMRQPHSDIEDPWERLATCLHPFWDSLTGKRQ